MLHCSLRQLNAKQAVLGFKSIWRCNVIRINGFHSRILSNCMVKNHGTLQNVVIQPCRFVENAAKESVSYNIGSFFGNMKQYLSRYMVLGITSKNLYESCADHIQYEDFFRACKMPDTFQSWFYVMHLHLWMVLVRLKPEGKMGKNISYHMVELMWKDVEERTKLMGVEDTSERKESMEELAQQFFGMIIAYDEGLLGHDRVLSSALWRNLFYNKQSTDAESLAAMVGYVRKQVQYLETQDSEEIISTGKIKWLPFHEEGPSKPNITDPFSLPADFNIDRNPP